MKRRFFILFSIMLMLSLCILNSCKEANKTLVIGKIEFKSLSINKKSSKDFMDLGAFKKVVKLETNDDSIIGIVDTAIVDENGDFFVGDYSSSKKVFRFDKYGEFINSYGRIGQGPGEFANLKSFDVTAQNEVVLMSYNKLLKFSKNGDFLKESRLKYRALDIKVVKGLIYIYVAGFRFRPEEKRAIIILNKDFNEVGGLSNFETRFEKYKFIPFNIMAKNRNNLFYIDIYDLGLNKFNPGDEKLIKLKIPNDNENLNDIWEKRHLQEKDRIEIKKKTHRFISILSMEEKLFLTESCPYKRIFNYWLLDLDKRKALILTYPGPEYFEKALFFDRIVGAYDRGLICVFNNSEKFNKYKSEFPALENIEFAVEDNPILVLFEFNDI